MEIIGLDLHKRESQLSIKADDGSITDRRIATSRERFTAVFGARPPARILLEASTESEWVARHLESLGPGSRGGLRAPAWASPEARVRCVRIWSITDAWVMKATIRIVPWHDGHASGSTSKICWRSAAHRRDASVGASRGAGTIAGGTAAAVGSALPRMPRGRLAYQP